MSSTPMIGMMIIGINKEDNMTIEIPKEKVMEAIHKFDSIGEIAEYLGVTRVTLFKICMTYYIKSLPDGRKNRPDFKADRARDIFTDRQIHNLTYSAIGKKHGITRQRVFAILKGQYDKSRLATETS
jgi:hypothetical protein